MIDSLLFVRRLRQLILLAGVLLGLAALPEAHECAAETQTAEQGHQSDQPVEELFALGVPREVFVIPALVPLILASSAKKLKLDLTLHDVLHWQHKNK